MMQSEMRYRFWLAPPTETRRTREMMVIGFPIALVIALAFELTPEGLKRTEVDCRFAAFQRSCLERQVNSTDCSPRISSVKPTATMSDWFT